MAQTAITKKSPILRRDEPDPIPAGQRPTRKADDASGINPAGRMPIHPKMPHLPPA
jgi:hypothetical protein